GIERGVDVAKDSGIAQEDQADPNVFHRGNPKHSYVSAANERFVDRNKETDQEDHLTELNREPHDVRSINPVQRRAEELLVVKQHYLRRSASIRLPRSPAPY